MEWTKYRNQTLWVQGQTFFGWFFEQTVLLEGLTNGFKHVPFVSEITVETAELLKLKHAFGDKYLHFSPQICKMSSFIYYLYPPPPATWNITIVPWVFATNKRPFSAAHINHRVTAMSPLNASGKPTKTQVSVFEKWVFLIHDSERRFVLRTKKQNIGISGQNIVLLCFMFWNTYRDLFFQSTTVEQLKSCLHQGKWTTTCSPKTEVFWMRHDESSLSAVDTCSSNWINKGRYILQSDVCIPYLEVHVLKGPRLVIWIFYDLDYLLLQKKQQNGSLCYPSASSSPRGSRTHINVQLDGTQLFLLVTDFLSTCADVKNRCRCKKPVPGRSAQGK